MGANHFSYAIVSSIPFFLRRTTIVKNNNVARIQLKPKRYFYFISVSKFF